MQHHGTAVEPFREKNNNVKPSCNKNLSGKVLLTDFFLFLNIFLLHFSHFKRLQCLYWHNGSVSNARGTFVLLNSPKILALVWMVENR